ncbi:MAG: hypothetical protein CVU85_02780 [Firmicutes bacterium HGW-Firmicutes-10]|nr:MAG: hypothetical protein CVU85_02780 [Firmicutes bacterium HGW-Firmicutes-10]
MEKKRRSRLDIRFMCNVAKVSRSGYYAYKKHFANRQAKDIDDATEFMYIKAAYEYKGYKKGAKQIKMRLDRDFGINMNLKKIRRLMRKFNLICPLRKANPIKAMIHASKSDKTYGNVIDRNFRQGAAKKTLLTDITYIQYGKGKRAYLSTVKDSSTQMILAWQLSTSLELKFVIDTVKLLLAMYSGELDMNVVLHSDQGCHYTSINYQTLLRENGIIQSMSRKGNCWDNAPQESFYAVLKTEVELFRINTYDGLAEDIIRFINYYNYDRPQWELHRKTPSEYDQYLSERSSSKLLLPMKLPELVLRI